MTPVIGGEGAPAPARAGRMVPAVAIVVLLGAVALAGYTGDLTPRDVVQRFAAAMDRGDPGDLHDLLHDDPTIVTWLPLLPSSPNASTMTLLDLGLADRVAAAPAYPAADYQAFHQGVGSHTWVTGCEVVPPRTAEQARLYDSWVDCHFAATNEVTAAVTGGSGTLRGRIGFGIADQRIRAVLVRSDPTPGTEVREFQRWMWIEHPHDFARYMRGRFQDPMLSAESAAALGELARAYAAGN